MNKSLSVLFSLGCCTLSNLWFSNSASAQISVDGTTNTTVNNDNNGNFTIEQGDRAGNNLFHSFGDFSVPNNGSAFFNNATDISNIFSRVTGGNISNIDGLLGANGSANLFLVNPAGILFGNNARLDIGGSFLGTTADSILFEDGVFSATDLDNPPLLTINAPIGLNFRNNPNEITNRAGFQEFDNGETLEDGGLTVNQGEFITLVGGNINLENGRLTAPGGRIELGGLSEAGTIQLNPDLGLNFAENLIRSDVSLTGIAELDVTSGGGGDINIYGQNINVLEGSDICAGIGADGACGGRNDNFGSVDAQAGDITFNALETITIGDPISVVNNQINTDAFGNAGDIIFESKSLVLDERGEINANIFGEGNAGNIIIDTEFLSITTSNITSGVFGQGNAGNITINASELVEIDGDIPNGDGEIISPGGILNQVERNGVGQGGDLTIETPLLNVSNGGKVQVATFGEGTPGNLSIRASDINVFNTEDSNNQFTTGIFAGILLDPRNEQFASGEATSLTIETETLSVRGGAQVSAETSGIGNGSNIFINATELVEIVGTDNKDGSPSFIGAEVGSPDLDTSVDLETITRNGGNINIDTNQLNIKDGGQISASNFTAGNAGNINIFSNDIEIDGGAEGLLTGLFAQVGEDATGQGGNLSLGSEQLPIKQLNLSNGSQISVSTFGQGNAGSLSIFSNNIEIDGSGDFPSGLFASIGSGATGQGGNIFIETDSLAVTDGGRVAANVEIMGQGDAGTLEILAKESIVVDGTISDGRPSAITSVVNGGLGNGEGIGNGGDVTISTGSLSLTNGGRVSATSLGQGDGGDLTINASESIFINGFAERFRSGISVNALINDGDSGNANITTDQLTIEDGGTIEASNIDSLGVFTSGTGEPGNINIQANSISLNNGGRIDAATQSETGSGANINLQVADNITLQNNSFISAQAFGNANGGNLTIDTNFIIAFPNEIPGDGSDIIAKAAEGNGGNITITAESLLGIEPGSATTGNETNDIDASSDFGLDGTISIFTPDITSIQRATELPNNVVEPTQTVAQACNLNRGRGVASNFVINGKGGIPPLITAPMGSEIISVNGEVATNDHNSYAISTSYGDIAPARGVVKTADGKIILTATPVSGNASRMAHGSLNCG